MTKYKLLIVSVLLFSIFAKQNMLYAQKPVSLDSLKQAEREKHSPQRATIYSALLPGLGQAYNKKYWKIPIIYAGFAALTYTYIFSDGKYSDFLNEFTFRNTKDSSHFNPSFAEYSNDNILELKNAYQKDRELCLIGIVVLYALNIIDATVDGHLFAFDVSDNLSMNIEPYLAPNYDNKLKGGITLTFSPKINRSHSQRTRKLQFK